MTYCRDTSIVPPLHTHNSNSVENKEKLESNDIKKSF